MIFSMIEEIKIEFKKYIAIDGKVQLHKFKVP